MGDKTTASERIAESGGEGEKPELPPLFAYLADRDAFLRRFVMSVVIAPPPGMRKVRPGWLKR